MKPEDQQIAIAEACGFKIHSIRADQFVLSDYAHRSDDEWKDWRLPRQEGPTDGTHYRPDFLGDLNAIHQAALTLTPKERAEYCNVLIDVANAYVDFQTVEATAAERCEAFLRVKGLWTGGAIRG